MKKRTGILMTMPAIALILFLFVYPLFFNFYYSFFFYNLYTSPEPIFIGITNYVSVLNSSIFFNALRNTVFFTLASVTFEFMLGFILSLLLSKLRSNIIMGIISALCLLPWSMSEVVEGIIGQFLFSPRVGVINAITRLLFNVEFPWLTDSSLALWSIIFVDTWKLTPFFVLIDLSAILSIPRDPMDAMNVDGASQLQQIRYLIIPYMLPVFAISTIIRGIDAFTRIFGIVYIMTGGGPGIATDVIPLEIFNLGLRVFNWGMATTWGAITFLFSIILLIGYIYMNRRQWL
jgi:multiple sugar transport system permease protein